ncbi:MAG: hypothetical protein ACYCXA_13910 [Actinomycetes bacterium]
MASKNKGGREAKKPKQAKKPAAPTGAGGNPPIAVRRSGDKNTGR